MQASPSKKAECPASQTVGKLFLKFFTITNLTGRIIMHYLECIENPIENDNLKIQQSIMNMDPYFNKVSIDKETLTDQDMYEYTKGYIDFGAEYLWIRVMILNRLLVLYNI
jgi:hypothetical protein